MVWLLYTYSKQITMSIATILLVLIVFGVILWLVNTYIPPDTTVKKIINIVAVILIVLWLLQAFGLLSALGGIRVR